MFLSPLNITPLSKKGIATTPFNPLDLNPYIWLDGSSESLGSLQTWTNKGTSGVNAIQNNASFRPNVIDDGSNRVVDFDTSSKYLDLQETGVNFINPNNNIGGFEVWKVIKLDDGRAGTPCYLGARSATKLNFQFCHGGSGKLRLFLNDTVGANVTTVTQNSVFPTGQTPYVLVRIKHDEVAKQVTFYVNGVEMTNDPSFPGDTSSLDFTNYNPSENIYINGRNNAGTHDAGTTGMFTGDIYVFNKVLTDNEATNLTNHLI